MTRVEVSERNGAFNDVLLSSQLNLTLDVTSGSEKGVISSGTTTRNTGAFEARLTRDDETEAMVLESSPELGLVIEASSIEEGEVLQGLITRNSASTEDLVVQLSGLPLDQISYPTSLVLPAGETSVSFAITAIDDDWVDGDQQGQLVADAEGFIGATNSLLVKDNDLPTLKLFTNLRSAPENSNILIGTVVRNTDTTNNLLLGLSSTDPTAASVPSVIVIPAGESSVDFTITPVDDAIVDGPQDVVIHAHAPGFISGQTPVAILDDDVNSDDDVVVNNPPVGYEDAYSSVLFQPVMTTAETGVLRNDLDADQDVLTAALVKSTDYGTLQLNEDGSFFYVPKLGFTGVDHFAYSVSDGLQASGPLPVSLHVDVIDTVLVDAIQGSSDADQISGQKSHDLINGLNGNDSITGGLGNDTILGGHGSDLLQGFRDHDLIDGGADQDTLIGGNGNDTMVGGTGDDLIQGQTGHDLLVGGNGADTITGHRGNDTLIGGGGDDLLRGGAGADLYVISAESGVDRFDQFFLGQDKIGLAEGLKFSDLEFESSGLTTKIFVNHELLGVVRQRNRGVLADAAHFMEYTPSHPET